MSRKQVLTVVALLTVFSWSVVMAAMGHAAAITTLVPALALSVQQVVQACTRTDAGKPAATSSAPRRDEEHAG